MRWPIPSDSSIGEGDDAMNCTNCDELLEALEDALGFVRKAYKVQEMDDLGPWPEEMIAQLQAAIAKAKGEGDDG